MEPAVTLAEDLASEAFEHGVAQRFWELARRDGDVVYVRLYAPDERNYLIRLACDSYGAQAIHGGFVDPVSLQCVASAWPQGDSIFSQWMKFAGDNLFICWDQDRGGISHHQEWFARNAWKRGGNQLVAYLDFLRQMLWLPARGYNRK